MLRKLAKLAVLRKNFATVGEKVQMPLIRGIMAQNKQPQSLLAEANPESHVNRSKAQRKLIRQNGTIQASRTARLQQKTGLRDMALPLQPYPSALFLFLVLFLENCIFQKIKKA